MPYDLKPARAPRVAGRALRALVKALENPLTSALLEGQLLRDAGVLALRDLTVEHPPLTSPDVLSPEARADAPPAEPGPAHTLASTAPSAPTQGFAFATVRSYTDAYRAGTATPESVAEKLLAALEQDQARTPPMRAILASERYAVMAAARASTERWRKGEPCGPLDGVPVAVKDELDLEGYTTTVGTRFLGTYQAPEDAFCVGRLRGAGALLYGKANMHEIGIGVTGINPHHGAVRNPYDPARFTGGSSSGSAASVAAGYNPLAVGADGGGSVRIPAALCGVVGLKPTFGRVSEHGAAPLCWSVGHVGPIAATVDDAALALALMSANDDKDLVNRSAPPLSLAGLGEGNLTGLRVGVFRAWFDDCDAGVHRACSNALEVLRAAGASIVEVTLEDLALMRAAHLVTIVSEMAASQLQHYAHHRELYGNDTRINLALARRLTAYDYVQAQRVRARMNAQFREVFTRVDVLATPTTACTAGPIHDDALQGESNLPLLERIMRFAHAANLLGLPGLSVPAGYDENAMPVGFQLMGRPWQEATLLRAGRVIEAATPRRAPRVHHALLG